jgi:hypothetical protein
MACGCLTKGTGQGTGQENAKGHGLGTDSVVNQHKLMLQKRQEERQRQQEERQRHQEERQRQQGQRQRQRHQEEEEKKQKDERKNIELRKPIISRRNTRTARNL